MTIDKLQRLFQALDGSSSTNPAQSSTQRKEQTSADAAPRQNGQAVQIDFQRSQAANNEQDRGARVAELKRQHDAGELKPVPSEALAKKLIDDFFV